MVESIALPAHAQTSPIDVEDGDFFTLVGDLGSTDNNHFRNDGMIVASRPGFLDWLIGSAHAGAPAPPEERCDLCGFCARIRGGRVTVTLVGIVFESQVEEQVCYEATGNVGGTASFSQVAGPDACPVPTTATIVRLEGEAPNRTLVVSDGSVDIPLDEDRSRTCNCNAFICLR